VRVWSNSNFQKNFIKNGFFSQKCFLKVMIEWCCCKLRTDQNYKKAAKNVEERRRCRHKFWIIDWRHFLPIVEKINDKSISTLHAENNGVGPKTVKTIVKSDTEKTPFFWIWYTSPTILEIWFKKVMKFGITNKFKQLFSMKQIHKNIKV
jgi:hypothetical protein